MEAMLVLELDGEQHAQDDAQRHDCVRDAFLREQGYEVLRFWNREIFTNMDGVLTAILDAATNAVRAKHLLRDESME
jgi:BirA family biotin operon repressor/biotin-[acetyl-CoA-carboxylase] ligase